MASLRSTAECKHSMQLRLGKEGIIYDPITDPLPKIEEKKIKDKDIFIVVIGKRRTMVAENVASNIKAIISIYRDEVKLARGFIRRAKTKAREYPSRTPFTDLQDELNNGLGVLCAAVGIVFVTLLGCGYYIINYLL